MKYNLLNKIVYLFFNRYIFLILTRVLSIFYFSSFFNYKNIDKKIKILFSYIISYFIFINQNISFYFPYDLMYLVLIIKEFFLGICIGFIIQYAFVCLHYLSDFLNSQMGFSFSVSFNLFNKIYDSIISRFLNIFFILIFLNFKGHLWFIKIIFDSFYFFPLNTSFSVFFFSLSTVRFFSFVFLYSLLISLPILFIFFTMNIFASLLNRMIPQFSFFSIFISLTLLTGIILLKFFFPMFDFFLNNIFFKFLTMNSIFFH